MGDNPDLTLVILGKIHDEICATRETLAARIDATNERLDATNERLDTVIREQIRHGTAIIELQQGQRTLEAGQREIVGALNKVVDTLVTIDRRVSALEQGQERIVTELHAIHDRIDDVLLGTMGATVREDHARLASVEARLSVVERRTQ